MEATKQKRPRASRMDDICRIIETASKSGVVKLKFHDVEVEFSPSSASLGTNALVDPSNYISSNMALPDSEQKDEFIIQDPAIIEQLRRSQLMIDDPMAFEQEMIDIQLEDEREAIKN